jgi:hypothetical protein
MKKLTAALLFMFAITGCAYDPDQSFELADDVAGTIGPESSDRPTDAYELADEVTGSAHTAGLVFELEHDVVGTLETGRPHLGRPRCETAAFVGCTSDGAAAFCGDDGHSLTVENCPAGCDADGCIDTHTHQFPH